MFNALFVLIVFLLQLNKDQLHVDWPLGVKTNITYIEETSEVKAWPNPRRRCASANSASRRFRQCRQCAARRPRPGGPARTSLPACYSATPVRGLRQGLRGRGPDRPRWGWVRGAGGGGQAKGQAHLPVRLPAGTVHPASPRPAPALPSAPLCNLSVYKYGRSYLSLDLSHSLTRLHFADPPQSVTDPVNDTLARSRLAGPHDSV